ncbi:hypothetical protein evm_004044 [Chilo suppressalis]|nr:hypothetical protein evm_004044 [Chilo suppressalis]
MSEDDPPAKRMKIGDPISDDTDINNDEFSKKQTDQACNPKYNNFVTAEELEKLKEFKVLDEVKSNDEDSNDESDSSDGKSEVPEEEIEKMLEEDLPEGFKGPPQPKEKPYVTRQKIVLEEKGVNHWEVLPLDWMMVRHYSGMPVYMHRSTRVCTLSKPYFLGTGNTRRHDIPISAIPCLAYRRALEEEKKQQEIDRKIEEQIKNGTWANNLANINQSNVKSENIPANDNNEMNKSLDISDSASHIIKTAETPTDDNAENAICNGTLDTSDIEENKVTSIIDISEETNNDKTICKSNIDTKTSSNCPFKDEKDKLNTEIRPELVCPVTGKHAHSIKDRVPKIDEIDAESNINARDNIGDITQVNGNVGNCDNNEDADLKTTVGESNVTGENVQGTTEEKNTAEGSTEVNEGDNEKSNDDIQIPKYRQPVIFPGGIVMPPPTVETINNSWKTQHLSHEQVNDYCKKLFIFKTINIMHFNRWADRRKYNKARKTLQYPTLPDGTKLITIPARQSAQDNGNATGGKPMKRDWVMNMDGRSYLSVFHEYVRRALQKQPVYEFVQLENAATPYQATVYIGGMQYGVGRGSSKRQAKSAAARSSIHILIPEMKDDRPKQSDEPDFSCSFFDYVGIEDPRISEFCAATCEPSPHAILRTCLLRNFGASDRHIHTEMKKLEFQKIELTMKVGKHSATVVCKNKKTAKQRASQAILQALHPHVRSWGSLLRLYGSRSVKSSKEKKLEEQQITLLQDRARHNQPNKAVLDKLRADMVRLRDRDAACAPIGTLLLEEDLPTHSGSNLNNVDL